jgi:hypothetical protein
MFDSGICSEMKPEQLAYASSGALRALRVLLTREDFPVTQEVLMSIRSRFIARQGELFSPPVPQLQLPQEAYQQMLRLLARMMNEYFKISLCPGTPRGRSH